MNWIVLIIAVVLTVGYITYVALDMGLRPLTEAEQEKAPGDFITVTGGRLHYRWDGPATGPVVVMVHGFSTPHFIFEQNVSALTSQGYRVLRYDHFGRGWSDRPRTAYTVDFYDTTLMELLDGLNITAPVGLVGLSMGGPIVAEFAGRHTDRVNAVFLFVPAGLDVAGGNDIAAKIVRLPGIGDLMWRIVGRGMLLGDPQYDESGLAEENRLVGDIRTQMDYRGYLDSLLSTLRNTPMTSRTETYRQLAATGMPVAAVFGADDPTVLPSSADKLRDLVPEASIHMLENADHGLNYKRQDATNPLLADFFSPKNEPAS
ncbi:alpha/beta fold hydrolase [Pyruvatibacter sp.]